MLRNNYFGETKTHYKLYKCGKNWAVMGISLFSLGLGMLVTGQPVSADVTATSTSSSAVRTDAISASSSSAAKAETTSASSSSAAKAETTSASSSSAAKAETTSASSSSAAKAETTSASSSSAAKAETTSASSSSAVKAETTSASSSSAAKAETTSASSSSAVKAETTSAGGNQIVAQIATNVSKNDAIVTTKFAQNYGRRVLAGSVTNTGFSVSDPDYPSGMWIDPDKSHYSYEWLQAKYGGNQIVLSTNRTGDGIVYVTELSPSNAVLKQYTLNQNTKVPSAVFDSTTYYNDTYYAMVESLKNPLAVKYLASKYDSGYYNRLSYMVPKLITQTTHYVDKDGKQITDSNGNPVVAYTQKGLVGQNYTTSDVNVINGYYAIAPSNSNGVMSPYGEIGASYVKNFHDGIVITYTQTGSDGTMSASIAQYGKVLKTWTNIKPSDPAIKYQVGSTTSAIKNPYIPQTSDVVYVYSKLGNWVVSNPDGSTKSIIYPNDPSDPTKIADSSVLGYPVIDFLPGYTPEDHMGTPLVPVDPDDRTKGYIPPIPSDNGTDTTITYTADKQKGSVSYVDDTTGKTLKTDSISGTTGSKSSYSTSGSIADYKKQGYELVTDGYPADLTFDNDDTTDQNFTVHLKHRLTPVNPTDPKTPGTPINPDEPDGPKWPTRTNYDKTVNETISYVDQNGQVVAKQHTDSVNFTRTVVVDNVTGEVITSGDGTTAWTATNGDTTFDAVVSPVVPGSVADKAQTAAVTDLKADSADVNETVTYTKVGSLVPSSSDGNFPETPKVVYPNDPSDATKVTPAGVPTVPGYTAHDPEGHVLTPGSSYQPSDPTKDTTITYTADKQKGSVSYVDDTTGKTLKTDSISGTTGSKSSYSTSGSIADYKKQGYELVTDGYPADLTFDNDDTTDQNFTVHLKHQNIQSTEAKTVTETIHYQGAGNQTPADNTAQVTFTRQVSTDAVTGEKTYGSWSADQSFAAVTSPVIKGYTPDQVEIGAQTVSGDASDLDFTVVYTKDAPAKPVNPSQPTTPAKPVNPSQPTTPAKPVNPSQPATPTKPVNPSQPTTPTKPVNPSQPTTPTKPVQAGQAAATNFVDQRLPQTDETDQQHMTLSGLLLLAMSSLLGLFGMTKRQRKE
ncbi:mucin-binding protein [Pediococcus pentosaceus]|uniref:LPXTG cell wall anchor domain-containing protein n=5 Tax=Pediococcus pentosaceus TaxID=1255 RepID=A0ABQ6XES1_PEDPE|nr:KxYKxGKxW signal peptide domain-containing protein [Pediococcus pentosaceus]KAF0412347.1 LPXTG cell wall anchor domain-containing protein [Pediococcus pentosaceus]